MTFGVCHITFDLNDGNQLDKLVKDRKFLKVEIGKKRMENQCRNNANEKMWSFLYLDNGMYKSWFSGKNKEEN